MALTTLDDLIYADKHIASVQKTSTSATQVAGNWATYFAVSGVPTAALASPSTVAVGGSSAGVIPAKNAAGYLSPITPNGGESAYVVNGSFANSLGVQVMDCGMIHMLYAKLWHVNVTPLTALGTATISAPPSYSGLLLNPDYIGTMIVLEVTTAISATATTIAVTYTNQAGTTGRTTGASPSLSGFAAARWVVMPLQAGDTGVQKIETIIVGGVVATAGAVNVSVIYPIMFFTATNAQRYEIAGYERCGVQYDPDQALAVAVLCNGTSTGQLDCQIELVSH
jgi:hypothetical protein